MSFDLFQSRRTYNEPCKYWTRNESDEHTSDELIMNRVPSGTFMAKEITAENIQNTQIGNTFMFDRSNITIMTPDNVYGIKNNDLVMFQGEKWIVVDVQKRKAHMQQSQFASDRHCSHFFYIELRK